MRARRCGGCGAPLPDSEEGERITCQFCGMVHDPTSSAIRQIVVGRPVLRPGANPAVAIISVVFLIAVLAPLAFVFMQWRAASAVTSTVIRPPGPYVPRPSTRTPFTPPTAVKRTPRDLHDLSRGHHELDVAPPPGGYGALDAVTALPWALAIAQAWTPDARLERIDVERLRPDGTVNAADDAESRVQYRFQSPSRNEELMRRAELTANAEVNTGLWVRLSDGKPQVYVNYTTAPFVRMTARVKGPLPAHPASLPLTTLLTRPGAQRALKPVPFYSGYMIHVEGEGWVWYFSSLANETFPRLRARDGASYPYGR
jgi:hypothetical protein